MSNQSLSRNPGGMIGLLAGAAVMLAIPFFSSCRHDDPNADRPEFIASLKELLREKRAESEARGDATVFFCRYSPARGNRPAVSPPGPPP